MDKTNKFRPSFKLLLCNSSMHYGILVGIILCVLFMGCIALTQDLENKTGDMGGAVVKKNETKSDISTNKGEILIKEKETVTISNWYVQVDSIWIKEGIIRTDIVMWAKDQLKPLEGGYKTGDEVKIGITDDKRYVKEIKKFGKNNEQKGYVILVEKKPQNITTVVCDNDLSIEETTKAHVGEVELGKSTNCHLSCS